MSHRDIRISSKKVRPHKAYIEPHFNETTILVSNHFDYVELWLKRQCPEALYYWNQSKNLFLATETIPIESKPLTAYYCMLNAAKALLIAKKHTYVDSHGLSGRNNNNKSLLIHEIITTQENGIFPSLTKYFRANLGAKTVNLKDVLYNIPFVHRAFNITFRGSSNLFIPISDPHFVYQLKGHEAWFTAQVTQRQYMNRKLYNNQRGWEINDGEDNGFWIRRKIRSRWIPRGVGKDRNIPRLIKYHQKIRRDIKYIYGTSRLWYLKRNNKASDIYPWPIPSLTLMAMHRLSELCRYDPQLLSRHFDAQHNWLLVEFINLAPINFIDNIACEITGRDLMLPGYRSRK